MPSKKEAIDVIKTVENIFTQAIEKDASDIHIELTEKEMIVRFRMDGFLKIMIREDPSIFEPITSRIKILAQLETTGIPKPQEGKIKFNNKGKNVDLRISVFPTSNGEAIVVRVLENLALFNNYENMGFTPEQAQIMEEEIRRSLGLILVTGPNGSGKSTTLVTSLNKINSPEKSIVTLEDPVERKINMVRQTQINPEIGLDFASGLHFLLRQDPDIIMVGEIRDKQTAQICVQAAITGHLVLATFHTNDAAGAIIRLLNMHVEPFLLVSTLRLITAQRLARMNCPDCKEEFVPPPELIKRIGAPAGMKYFKSKGCEKCEFRGTKGRVGIHEVLKIDKKMGDLILSNPSKDEINELAKTSGMLSLREAALLKVNEGLISLEEALRITE